MQLRRWLTLMPFVIGLVAVPFISAQQGPRDPFDKKFDPKKGDEKGPREKGGPFGFKGGPGGPGGMMGQERKLVKEFDKDGDGRLNNQERKAAREQMKKDRAGFGGPGGGRGFGPPGGGFGPRGGNQDAPKPGPKVAPNDVKSYPDAKLYDTNVLRTLFFEFENDDWEAELADFHNTDVEVPATLTVDGKQYPNVGLHFRGMSSYGMVPAGSKRSLNVDIDFVDPKQKLYGYRTLNLLNLHEDPTFMGSVLYSHIARQYIPAPKANFVKVVINGESWGVYASVQQFNKEFLAENYKSTKGTRWKVRGSPGGDGGLSYVGENLDEYKRRYEIKSADDEKAWKALIHLCKVLTQTPVDQLEEALKPILDIDGVLWFLALDNALINCDGYWIRASDYSIYRDEKGVFHILPHDMNESFRPAGGPGFGGPGGPGGPGGFGGPGGPGGGFPGGPGGGFPGGPGGLRPPQPGEILPLILQDVLELTDEQRKQLGELQKDVNAKLDAILTPEQRKQLKSMREGGPFAGPGNPFGPPGGGRGGNMGGGSALSLDPLIGLEDARKPLRSRLLAVPALKARYLSHVRTIAEKSLDWKKLGPVVEQYRSLIEKEVEADTRKLTTFSEFLATTSDQPQPAAEPQRRGPHGMNLRAFADQRRSYLLSYTEPKKVGERNKP